MKIFISIFFIILSLLLLNTKAYATYEPLSRPNNTFGVHILFPEEVFEAKDLVNTNGGDWGYVTIPIQANDKDLDKWQTFMDDCRDFHLIPILRLATNGDYFDTKVWEKPKYTDILDFANFLNSLNWPTKNRYVIIYNEVNRADEWGGTVSPAEYTDLLDFAIQTFKSKNPDFFVISAGLDNAAPNSDGYMNEYDFLNSMYQHNSNIFNRLDGMASHSYPNPGFSVSPYYKTPEDVYSFQFEDDLIKNLSGRQIPVFITETNWSNEKVPADKILDYLSYSFKNIWSDERVVAVTPFLLKAGPPFENFSLVSADGGKSQAFTTIENIQKVKGDPLVSPKISDNPLRLITLPIRHFIFNLKSNTILDESIKPTKSIFKWLLHI